MSDPGPAQGPSTATADHTAYATNHSLVQREVKHLPSWFVVVMSMVAGVSLVLGVFTQVERQGDVSRRATDLYNSNLSVCAHSNEVRTIIYNYIAGLPTASPDQVNAAQLKRFQDFQKAMKPVDCAATIKGGK